MATDRNAAEEEEPEAAPRAVDSPEPPRPGALPQGPHKVENELAPRWSAAMSSLQKAPLILLALLALWLALLNSYLSRPACSYTLFLNRSGFSVCHFLSA